MKRALISVSDKSGIIDFANTLVEHAYEIISTGGTYKALAEAGVPVIKIDDVTGFPEILDGRVKTLHPKIHGGLLALRNNEHHTAQVQEHGIQYIDLVCVNLYPFTQTVASGAPLEECIEQIDIGGPSMLRSASKNFASVTVVCDPADYDTITEEIAANGDTSYETRALLAKKCFQHTSAYDAAIASYLETGGVTLPSSLPQHLAVSSPKLMDLRYGENPHQAAALYGSFFDVFEQLHGKELSFNNIVDIQASSDLVEEFEEPAAAIIKHTNPCGCAVGNDILDAYTKALTSDIASAYGGIVCVNRTIDVPFAEKINQIFTEVVIAPGFTEDALEILKKKANRRLMLKKASSVLAKRLDIKSVANGYLCQTLDMPDENPSTWKIVTKRAPSEEEMKAMAFAWKTVKHVKSNSIVYTNAEQILAVGAGQMSRVDSAAIARMKAKNATLELTGSVGASDAFFPFPDGLLEIVKAGCTAVVQPGGSIRDQEVIEAADAHNIAMVFTGHRHFKH